MLASKFATQQVHHHLHHCRGILCFPPAHSRIKPPVHWLDEVPSPTVCGRQESLGPPRTVLSNACQRNWTHITRDRFSLKKSLTLWLCAPNCRPPWEYIPCISVEASIFQPVVTPVYMSNIFGQNTNPTFSDTSTSMNVCECYINSTYVSI